MAIFATAAAPAFADLSPDPAPSGPSPDAAPVKPQPKPVSHPAPAPVTQTPAPVVRHTPAPAPVRVVPRVTSTPVVTPAPAPAPVRHVAHKAKRHAPAHRRVVHQAKPKPSTAADPVSVAVRAPVRAVRTAVTAPVKVAEGHGSTTAKLLVIAALALLLVAVMSASLLRLLVRLNGPQRGW